MNANACTLSGRHVVVTGGTGALGGAVVQTLIARGATVHVPVRGAAVRDTAAWKGDPRVRVSFGVDLTDEPAVDAFFGAVPPLWASVHVAGGFAMAPLAATDLATLRRQLDLNVVSCLLSCRGAVGRIRASGQGGRILNVAAGPVLRPVGGMVAYSAAKAGVAAITESLAIELAAARIHVNAIVPGIMDTPTNRKAMPDADRSGWSALSDVAEAVAFLVSPANANTTGVLMPV